MKSKLGVTAPCSETPKAADDSAEGEMGFSVKPSHSVSMLLV